MTTFKVSEVRQLIDSMRDDESISSSQMEVLIKKNNLNSSIVGLIKATVDNYVSKVLREKVVAQLTAEGVASELIPTIALGRRAGHTTAIVNYARQVKDKNVYIITYSDCQVKEILDYFYVRSNAEISACFRNDMYHRVSDNVFVMNSTSAARNLSRIAPKDSVILFDSSFAYNKPLITNAISELYLKHYVLFLGN